MSEWRKIIINGEETNYSVSDDGQVKNDITEKILSLTLQQGYQHITITVNKKQKNLRVHRLVAIAFIPNPENKPYVNHIDGDRKNNKVANLEWVTPQENIQHAHDNGLVRKTRARQVIQYSLMGEEMITFISAAEAARELGLHESKIILCCQRQRMTTGDYQWRYADDPNKDVKPITDRMGYHKSKKVAQLDDNDNILNIYSSYSEAARAVNGTQSAISRVCSGLNVHHKGYKWKIVEEIVQEEI